MSLNHLWFDSVNFDGYFDSNGKNIAGPPPTPLLAFSVKQEGDVVVIVCPQEDEEEAKQA